MFEEFFLSLTGVNSKKPAIRIWQITPLTAPGQRLHPAHPRSAAPATSPNCAAPIDTPHSALAAGVDTPQPAATLGRAAGQQKESVGFGTANPNRGRNFRPIQVPSNAKIAQIHPCALAEATPEKYAPMLQPAAKVEP